MSLRFEWDPEKAAANLAKHDVSFEEALTVFSDPLARIFDGEDHSSEEECEIIHRTFNQASFAVSVFHRSGYSNPIF